MPDSRQSRPRSAGPVQVIQAHTNIHRENDQLVATAWKRNGSWIIQAMDQRMKTQMLRSPLIEGRVRVTTQVQYKMAYHVVRSRREVEKWLRENIPPGTTLWAQDPGNSSDLVRL